MTTVAQPRPEFTVLSTQAANCRKALHLHIQGTEPSNPRDDRGINLLQFGYHAQSAAFASLERQGWTLRRMTQEFTLPIKDGPNISCRPRIIGSHPDITEGKDVVIKVVSSSDSRFNDWDTAGTLASHPDAYADLGFCYSILAQSGLVDEEQPQVFVIMNRDTGQIDYDLIEPEDLQRRAHAVARRLQEMSETVSQGQELPAEYERDSMDCKFCLFLDLCHGPEPEADPEDPMPEEQFKAALEVFAEAEAELEKTKKFNNPRRKALDTIKDYLRSNNLTATSMDAGGKTWNAKLNRGEPKLTLVEERLKDVLTDEQLAAVYEHSTSERISITAAKS